jgi:Tat protein translocase TatB subunit
VGSVGPVEILVILVVALIVLGPERLPQVARQAGQLIGELRRMAAGFQAEMREVMDVDAQPRPAPYAPPSPEAEPPDPAP